MLSGLMPEKSGGAAGATMPAGMGMAPSVPEVTAPPPPQLAPMPSGMGTAPAPGSVMMPAPQEAPYPVPQPAKPEIGLKAYQQAQQMGGPIPPATQTPAWVEAMKASVPLAAAGLGGGGGGVRAGGGGVGRGAIGGPAAVNLANPLPRGLSPVQRLAMMLRR